MNNKLDSHVSAYQGGNLYDFDNEILLNWYPQRIIVQSQKAHSLLELGLGHGLTTNKFSKCFERHVVVEGSSAVIQHFHEKFPKCSAEIIEDFFETFEITEQFDVIVMGFILEHVDDPLLIIQRFKNFLKPGGALFLAVPNAAVLNRQLGHMAGLLSDLSELSENDLLLGHKRYYTVQTLADVITQAGCKIDKLEGIYLKPFTTRQMISLKLQPTVIHALCEVGIHYPELSCGIFAKISVS